MSADLLRVDGLTIGYRTRRGEPVDVLVNVSLEMRAGETVGLVGESGCGKSTLGLALLGYLRHGGEVRQGKVLLGGQDLFALRPAALAKVRGRKVSLIPQNPGQSLTPTMRVGAQIAEVLSLHLGYDRRLAHARVVELLSSVHMPQPEEMVDRYPHQLSGGQCQRATIAMALAAEPELLVLDEPTTGIDVTTQAHILGLLREIHDKTGTAMLYISHNIGAIAQVCTRLAVMYGGEIVEDGSLADLFAWPVHPYTVGLLGSVPRLSHAGIPRAMGGRPPAPGEHLVGCSFAPRCAFADETCRTVWPETQVVKGDGAIPHTVRCHHWQAVAAHHAEEEYELLKASKHGHEPILELTGTHITYSKRGLGTYLRHLRHLPQPPDTVADIDLSIYRGETLALVGESGSGKSTIARTVVGLLPPSAGRQSFEGKSLPAVTEKRSADLHRRIQIVFQNPEDSLNPRQTIRQILDAPLQLYTRASKKEREQRAIALLERVRLSPLYLERYPAQLSGGEKQRVAVARAFAADPDLVLCDEVTSSLDVSVQAAALRLLGELQAERGAAYLFISHDLAVVRAVADRVAVLYQGRLCQVGGVEQTYAPPYHPYTETLLAAVPEPKPGARARLLAKDVQESAPPARGCSFQRRCPRRIGAICDEVTPPWQTAGEGHQIRCHIALDELRAAQIGLLGKGS